MLLYVKTKAKKEGYYKDFKSSAELELKYSVPGSYEISYTPGEGEKADGQYKINDIAYGTEYPNSFLGITYPDSNREEDRPTLFYFHGGGFFGGSKKNACWKLCKRFYLSK